MHPRMIPLKSALALALALGAAPALQAQERPVEMKFAHWVPAQHPLVRLGFEPWVKSIQEASKGSIKIAIFPAQQLGKAEDHYDMARDGIADVTWVNPGYQAGRFPIFAAGELPFLMGNPGGGSGALDAWYRKYAEREMKDVKMCLAHLHIGTIHAKQPITLPTQIKGMKIRSANGTVAQMVTLLGGTNVRVSAPEARDALEKGVADAITFPWKSIQSFGVDKVTKFHTDMKLYASNFVFAMNKGWYDKLSPGNKKVIDDHCNNAWAERVGKAWGDDEDSGEQALEKAGHTIVKLTDAQFGEWRKAVAPVYQSWKDGATKAGANADQLLGELQAELRKRNATYRE
jgi:TRAP-type transport system periplasmic protein